MVMHLKIGFVPPLELSITCRANLHAFAAFTVFVEVLDNYRGFVKWIYVHLYSLKLFQVLCAYFFNSNIQMYRIFIQELLGSLGNPNIMLFMFAAYLLPTAAAWNRKFN